MGNAAHSALWGKSHFLLIFRDRQSAAAFIVEASSLAAARLKAATAGLDTENSFRLGHELDPELITLVPRTQIGRILNAGEAKELLTRFVGRERRDDLSLLSWHSDRLAGSLVEKAERAKHQTAGISRNSAP